jgi:hypothetical protein
MNLREVIEQLERGDVQRIRDKYGPQQGCAAHPMWGRIKVTINRHERLHRQLVDPGEFDGDKERFLEFFAVARNKLTHRRKRKKDNEDELEMLPYRLVVEAVPHRDKDIREEKKRPMYCDGGMRVGGEANDWEVWRRLDKEYYK